MGKLLLMVVMGMMLVSCGRACDTRCIDGHIYRKCSGQSFWVQVGSRAQECRT